MTAKTEGRRLREARKAPVGDDAVVAEAAQDLGAGRDEDAAPRLEVDHVRRRVHHPQRPAAHTPPMMMTSSCPAAATAPSYARPAYAAASERCFCLTAPLCFAWCVHVVLCEKVREHAPAALRHAACFTLNAPEARLPVSEPAHHRRGPGRHR